jgi:hypothetical protein
MPEDGRPTAPQTPSVDTERRIRDLDPRSLRSLDPLLAAAKAHGEGDLPDHETGDLIAMLRACWLQMHPKQREYILGEFGYLLEEWGD